MSLPMLEAFAERINSGLNRKSITSAARWACKYRFMGHPYPGVWNFMHHPWLKDMHDSTAELNIGQKSAQMGYTEAVLNISFYFCDVKRMDVLYVLPNTRPDAADFSSGRFDKALELSEHLQKLFSEVQNVGHKRAGSTNLYIRGSNARTGLKSIPVSLLVLDELDEMTQEHIPLAKERLMGQLERYMWMISTPTIPDFGINFYFNDSTQEHFVFKCPMCSKFIQLRFPDNLVVCGEVPSDPKVEESYLICNECKGVLRHEDKFQYINTGRWVADYPGRVHRGFHINQLYSMHLPPSVVARAYLESLRDPHAEQELYNSKLGLAHTVAGARITEDLVNACIGDYRKIEYNSRGLVTMGVDVGHRTIHVEIDRWQVGERYGNDVNTDSRPQVIWEGTVDNFEDLDRLMFDYHVRFCVVDSQPSRREAIAFANRFPGHVMLCTYSSGVAGRNISNSAESEYMIRVDRTSWLDLSLGRFKRGEIGLPIDATLDYKAQICAQVRIPTKDKDGNPMTKYETPGNRADHFGHARNYAEIALPFALGIGVNTDIRE